jgi:CBS domain-containing protein
MAQTVRDVMTANPRSLKASESIAAAAMLMRDEGINTVVVTQGGKIRGIVTDRDIVVRAVADGASSTVTQLGDICSTDTVTVPSDTSIDDAIEIMRMRSIRRLPVVDGDRVIGVVGAEDIVLDRPRAPRLADVTLSDTDT